MQPSALTRNTAVSHTSSKAVICGANLHSEGEVQEVSGLRRPAKLRTPLPPFLQVTHDEGDVVRHAL